MCMSVCEFVPVYAGTQGRPGRAAGSPRAGGTGSREPPDVSAGDRTLILCKSSKC